MKDYDFKRYSRQIFIEEIGTEGQRKIQNAKVLVIGAGGLGSPVIQYLAAAGVGTLGIADHDTVEIHNLNRQVIHNELSVGTAKVESATKFVKNLNSSINVIPIFEKIQAENIQNLISDYDIIVDGSDNFATRYLINDTCVAMKKTIVYGSILGFEGQVAIFNYEGSKNLRDIFPEIPKTTMDCDKNGVLGPLPGIVGNLMAMNVLKIICKLEVRTNQLLIIDTLHWTFLPIDF